MFFYQICQYQMGEQRLAHRTNPQRTRKTPATDASPTRGSQTCFDSVVDNVFGPTRHKSIETFIVDRRPRGAHGAASVARDRCPPPRLAASLPRPLTALCVA